MKWNLRWAAAKRDIWRPSDLLKAFEEVGFTPSLSKVAALWSGKPISVRLDDLDKMCAALGCTIADLLEAEPLAGAGGQEQAQAGGRRRRPARRPGPAGAPAGRLPPITPAELTDASTREEPAGRAVPGLHGLGREEAADRLRGMRQMAQSLPRTARLPPVRSRQPRQSRWAMPLLPADPPH